MNLISRFEFEFPCSRPNTCKTNDWPINLQPITFCLMLIARVIMVTMMVNTVNITPSAFQHCHCEHDVIMTTNQMCNVCVCAVTWSQVDVTFHWVCACVILSHPPSTRCISSPPPSSSVKILTSLLHHLVSSLCSSSSLSLWKKAASVQCKLKIRVRTHTRTHTHTLFSECWPPSGTLCGCCICMCLFCVLGTFVITFGWKKNIKMLRALVKCCTGSTKGGVGVLLASQTVIQTESWGDLRMRAARAYFTNLLCKPSAPRHARIRTRSHTRIQSGTVESTRGTCPYLTAPGHICANTHAHTHFHKAELGKGLSSSNTHLNT